MRCRLMRPGVACRGQLGSLLPDGSIRTQTFEKEACTRQTQPGSGCIVPSEGAGAGDTAQEAPVTTYPRSRGCPLVLLFFLRDSRCRYINRSNLQRYPKSLHTGRLFTASFEALHTKAHGSLDHSSNLEGTRDQLQRAHFGSDVRLGRRLHPNTMCPTTLS